MTEWIGHLIANWPLWAVVIVLIIASIVWLFYYSTTAAGEFPWKKKEWWQDRYKRLEKEAEANRAKLKVKKG